jgi:hypothetical protein
VFLLLALAAYPDHRKAVAVALGALQEKEIPLRLPELSLTVIDQSMLSLP